MMDLEEFLKFHARYAKTYLKKYPKMQAMCVAMNQEGELLPFPLSFRNEDDRLVVLAEARQTLKDFCAVQYVGPVIKDAILPVLGPLAQEVQGVNAELVSWLLKEFGHDDELAFLDCYHVTVHGHPRLAGSHS